MCNDIFCLSIDPVRTASWRSRAPNQTKSHRRRCYPWNCLILNRVVDVCRRSIKMFRRIRNPLHPFFPFTELSHSNRIARGWIETTKKGKRPSNFPISTQHREYSLWKWIVSASALISNHIRIVARIAAPLAKNKYVLHSLHTVFYWNIKALKWVCCFYCCTAIQQTATAAATQWNWQAFRVNLKSQFCVCKWKRNECYRCCWLVLIERTSSCAPSLGTTANCCDDAAVCVRSVCAETKWSMTNVLHEIIA